MSGNRFFSIQTKAKIFRYDRRMRFWVAVFDAGFSYYSWWFFLLIFVYILVVLVVVAIYFKRVSLFYYVGYPSTRVDVCRKCFSRKSFFPNKKEKKNRIFLFLVWKKEVFFCNNEGVVSEWFLKIFWIVGTRDY